jgi:hypothetical protein
VPTLILGIITKKLPKMSIFISFDEKENIREKIFAVNDVKVTT